MKNKKLTQFDVDKLNSKKGLIALLSKKKYNPEKAIKYVNYQKKIKKLQIELIRLQTWAIEKGERIIVIFEGRYGAGKGGVIRRIAERINPRFMRIVALPKPNKDETTQWYFQRYVEHFPKAGELVLFNRSWYNRAVVEPVNGFCTNEQYDVFMKHVNDFEKMIVDSGIRLVKVYLSIDKDEQAKRFEQIKSNPLKQWKISKVDEKAQGLWDEYTKYKQAMFDKTNTEFAPWKVIDANKKLEARINSIKYILSKIPYDKNLKI